MDILESLNEVQKQALLQIEGAVLVTAGAGSGKTKLLTHRIAYLIRENKIPEENILAITFTNKAASEMKDRVSVLLGKPNGVWISTFHSMCLKILREYIYLLGSYTSDFSVYSESDSEKTLKQVIKDLNLPADKYKHYSYLISKCQNENMDIYTYAKRYSINSDNEDILVYEEYEKALEKNNALDFDHLLTKTYELFVTHKDVLDYFANRFMYIFVDEFQDTNTIQYDLIKLLSYVHKNIFVVGDEDQCIYTWRGAKFQNIFDFKKDFAPVKMFKLEQNYRSTKTIIEKANKLISNNTERFDKVLWTANDEGKNVECFEFYDEQTEAESIASKIHALAVNGYQYNDIAILMRMNALTLPFEQKLLNYNIPYRIYGGFKFYERQEIKNIISYLRLFVNPNDDTALIRIINFPKRAIGDSAVNKIREYAMSKNMSMLSSMEYLSMHTEENSALWAKVKSFVNTFLNLKQSFSSVSLDEFCKLVIDEFNIRSAFMENTEENEDKLMNLDVFVNSVSEFIKANPQASLSEFLESITLETDLDFMGTDNTVTISTVHSVKGLEFKVVFIIGLEDGIFPISRSFESDKELEEERRLMYVAMTRARERLFLSYANTRYLHGRRTPMLSSRFLDEIGINIPVKPKRFVENNYNNYNNNYDNSYNYDYSPKKRFDFDKKSIICNNNHNGYTVANSIQNEPRNKKDTSIYKVGQLVKHPKFGQGVIMAIIDDGVCAEINFDAFGKKTLILEIAPLEIIN